MVRRRLGEVSQSMPSAIKIAIVGGALSLGVLLFVRWHLPETESVLTGWKIASAVLACLLFPFLSYLGALFPYCVHVNKKGICFQCGNSATFVNREQLRSVSFEDRDGLHLLVVRGETKSGRLFAHVALASSKISDSEVAMVLLAVGLAHVWKDGKEFL